MPPRGLTFRVFASVDAVPNDDWKRVRRDNHADAFMDLRFCRALEKSTVPEYRPRYVVIYDARGIPVAIACLARFRMDLAVIAAGTLDRIVRALRNLSPSFLHTSILLCGLPISLGQKSVLLARDADPVAVFALLDDVLTSVAKRENVSLILCKEFSDVDLSQTDTLVPRGYRRAQSLPTFEFTASVPDFDAYLDRLKSHYRADIKRSLRKLERSPYEIVRWRERKTIQRLYTEEVHKLYLDVVANSATRFEVLPIDFFLALAEEYDGDISLTAITTGERIVAFNWALSHSYTYQFLFCGIDYELNRAADLYFNIMYADFANGLMEQRPAITFGQTSEHFKTRLGCEAKHRYFYVKARSAVYRRLLDVGSEYVFPNRTVPPTRRIYSARYSESGVNPGAK